MGNFSRDTFDQFKQYTGVRLQQGVPLVDADWNELNDVIRQELYTSLMWIWGMWGDVIFPWFAGDSSFAVNGVGANNLDIYGGAALVDGRAVLTFQQAYDTQLWYDPAVAAAAGVVSIPPMTTPSANRTDVVYLDVWDREVNSTEDPNIVNPVIGIETSVRLKREYCYRVAEGQIDPPPAPPGHRYMSLARLNRTAGSDTVTAAQVEDLRRIIYGMPGNYYQSIAPIFTPMSGFAAWDYGTGYAYKKGALEVGGKLPINLPHRCRFFGFSVYGRTHSAAKINIQLLRSSLHNDSYEPIVNKYITGDPFSIWFTVPASHGIINSASYNYFIGALARDPYDAYIYGLRAEYVI